MKMAGMILAAALLVPVALSAQQGPPGGAPGRGMGMRMRSPIAIAIDHKADLTLTDDQVTKLQAIDAKLTEKNAPIRQKMQEARPQGVNFQDMTDEQRQAMRDKVMPLMQELMANTQEARTEAEKLLKPEQVTKLQEILQQEMPQRGPGGGAPPRQGN